MAEDAGTPADAPELPPIAVPDDRRALIALASIDPAPWNPKDPIAGKHRAGLTASLETFGVSDDLKVWPNPDQPGRYYALDGNQRLDVLAGRAEAVWCRVLDRLSDEDAKLFTGAFDRHYAGYNEAKLEALAAQCRGRSEALAHLLLRPPVPIVPLPPPAAVEAVAQRARETAGRRATGEEAQRVPFVMSLTPEGLAEVRAQLASLRTRLAGEEWFVAAVRGLAERETDDVVIETALRVARNGEAGAEPEETE